MLCSSHNVLRGIKLHDSTLSKGVPGSSVAEKGLPIQISKWHVLFNCVSGKLGAHLDVASEA